MQCNRCFLIPIARRNRGAAALQPGTGEAAVVGQRTRCSECDCPPARLLQDLGSTMHDRPTKPEALRGHKRRRPLLGAARAHLCAQACEIAPKSQDVLRGCRGAALDGRPVPAAPRRAAAPVQAQRAPPSSFSHSHPLIFSCCSSLTLPNATQTRLLSLIHDWRFSLLQCLQLLLPNQHGSHTERCANSSQVAEVSVTSQMQDRGAGS